MGAEVQHLIEAVREIESRALVDLVFLIPVVGSNNALKTDAPEYTLWQRQWLGGGADGRGCGEQLGQSLHRACRALDLSPHLGQCRG